MRIAPGMVTKSPITREIAEETVKTIVQGRPGISGEPVVTNARVFYHHARLRVHWAPGFPCALSLRARISKARAMHVARRKTRVF